ncbi:hypothetical protein H7142_00525 [Candidatus Saccharibacteria bacterium]|nr:hypothetical protein [Candidatus Saccharibacteria bacterium]
MTARISTITEDAVMISIDTPVEAIDLVFEELDLDPRTFEPRLCRETVLPLVDILRRGYGCDDDGLPMELAAVATMVRLDVNFSVGLGVFIDMLWDLRQEFDD